MTDGTVRLACLLGGGKALKMQCNALKLHSTQPDFAQSLLTCLWVRGWFGHGPSETGEA